MKKETELQIIPAELSTAIKDTKIEHSKAEQHAIAFAPSMQEYLTYAEIIKGLNKENPSDIDAKQAREARLKLVKVRTNAESIKDIRKEGIRAEGDLIQSLFNVVKNSCLVTESEYTEIEKHQERLEEKRKAELSEKRIALLAPFGTDTTYLPLGNMTDEQFDRLLENESLAFNVRKEAAEKAEQARIEAERIAAEKEAERIRLEAEERERIRLENEKLKAEAEEREKQAAIEREAAAKEAKRLADIAEKQRKENEAKLKAEREAREKIEAELKAKKEAEELAQLKERQRIEAEETERLAKEKAALLAPDKEKIKALFEAIKSVQIPECSTDEAKAITSLVASALSDLKKEIINLSQKLK